MNEIVNKAYVAWQIAYCILKQCSEDINITLTHPCGEQYECLTLYKNKDEVLLMIDLKGTHISVGNDIVEYFKQFKTNKAELLNRLFSLTHLRMENSSNKRINAIEFILKLLSISIKKPYNINIQSAFYDGSYHCKITELAKQFPHFNMINERDIMQWWTIEYDNAVALALLNLKTNTIITKKGDIYNLESIDYNEAIKYLDSSLKTTIKKPRLISETFIKDLEDGLLHPILEQIHRDDNLVLEIRNKYINIYYRGGNLLRIKENSKPNQYDFEFDIRYIKDNSTNKGGILSLTKKVSTREQVVKWYDYFSTIKYEMDNSFVINNKPEREFQQLVLRENNKGKSSKASDYFICDLEYQIENTRFDMIAIKKSKNGKCRLAIIEMKYLDSALNGNSGIIDHAKKSYNYLTQYDVGKLKEEMTNIIKIKLRLNLISNLSDNIEFSDETPEFIFLLANHKPASNILKNELSKLKEENFYTDMTKILDIKIATASFMGYCLFNECIYSLDEFDDINNALLQIVDGRAK